MKETLEALGQVTWGAHGAVLVLMAAGLVLWATGERYLKPLVVALLTIFFAVVGLLVLPETPWGDDVSPLMGLLIGGVLGVLIGLLTYRSAMAVSSGVVFSAAAGLGSAAYFTASASTGVTPQGQPSALVAPMQDVVARPTMTFAGSESIVSHLGLLHEPSDDITRSVRLVRRLDDRNGPTPVESFAPDQLSPEDLESIKESVSTAAEGIRQFLRAAKDGLDREMDHLTEGQRLLVWGAAFIGLVLGVLAGLALPAWAGTIVTAMAGSAVWLTGFIWLSGATAAPWVSSLERPATHWLIIWGACGVIGMGIQWFKLAGGRRTAS